MVEVVEESLCCFFKSNAVLLDVTLRLGLIPFKLNALHSIYDVHLIILHVLVLRRYFVPWASGPTSEMTMIVIVPLGGSIVTLNRG